MPVRSGTGLDSMHRTLSQLRAMSARVHACMHEGWMMEMYVYSSYVCIQTKDCGCYTPLCSRMAAGQPDGQAWQAR